MSSSAAPFRLHSPDSRDRPARRRARQCTRHLHTHHESHTRVPSFAMPASGGWRTALSTSNVLAAIVVIVVFSVAAGPFGYVCGHAEEHHCKHHHPRADEVFEQRPQPSRHRAQSVRQTNQYSWQPVHAVLATISRAPQSELCVGSTRTYATVFECRIYLRALPCATVVGSSNASGAYIVFVCVSDERWVIDTQTDDSCGLGNASKWESHSSGGECY